MDLSMIHPAFSNGYTAYVVIVVLWAITVNGIMQLIKHYAIKFTAFTKSKTDDILLKDLFNPIYWFIVLLGLYGFLPILPLLGGDMEIARRIIESGIIFLVVFSIARFVNVMLGWWGKKHANGSRANAALLKMFRRTISFIGIILGGLMILQMWGIEVGPLIASLGIAGVAIAFALQTTLGNVFGGLSLLLDHTYTIGDWVEIAGIMGVVEDVGIRSTKIKTWDNEIVTVPNGKAADDIIKNYTMPDDMIRVNITFGVEYGSNIEKVQKIVLEAMKKAAPKMLKDPAPYVIFTGFGESSLKFIGRFWLPDIHEKLFTQEKAAIAVYKALNKAKIGIPFPQMDLHIKDFKKQK